MTSDLTVMARAQASLWLCGALMTLAGLAAPRPPGAAETELLALALASLASSLVIWKLAGRIPFAGLVANTVLGTAGISVGMYFWHETGTEVDLLYIWVVLYAFYFFGRTWGLAFTALTGVAYGVTLAVSDPGGAPVVAWLELVGTALGAGLVISVLDRRIRGLVEALGRAAETDTLTGLLNRRGFETVFDAEIARCQAEGEPLGVIIADLDRFKRVNDELGHATGDRALRHLADCLSAVVRDVDVVARLGGEEFVVLAHGGTPAGAARLAEKLRRAVEASPHPEAGRMTISLGVSTLPVNGDDRAHLLAAADEALYAAKDEGRNRVRLAAARHPGPAADARADVASEPAATRRAP